MVRRAPRARLLAAVLAAGRGARSGARRRAAAVAAVALFVPLARAAAPSRTAGAVAAWLFTAGVLSNVAIGRMPFLLGIALGGRRLVGRARAAARARAACSGCATMLASPVAGVFLMLGAVAKLIADGRPALRDGAWLGLPTLAAGSRSTCCSPRAAPTASPRPRSGRCSCSRPRASRCSRPGRRTLWAGGLLYLGVLVGAFFVPSPFGQNALRLGVLAGPSVLALAHRRRVPVLALAVVGVGLLYLQWLPAVRAVAEAHGDPSTRLAFQAEARDFLAGVAKPGERVEVPMTKNHWEAADLAKVVPLARGWERQLDQKANPIFYDGEQLTAPATTTGCARTPCAGSRCRPRRWTTPRATRRSCSSAGANFLELVYESPRWRIWEVRDTDPPASGGATLLAAGPELVHGRRRASRPSCATATRRTGPPRTRA